MILHNAFTNNETLKNDTDQHFDSLIGLFADENKNNLLIASSMLRQSTEPSLKWLSTVLNQYLQQSPDKPKPVDFFMGLSGKTGHSLAVTQIYLKQRDHALLKATQLLQQEHRCTLRTACEMLNKMLNKNERWRKLAKEIQRIKWDKAIENYYVSKLSLIQKHCRADDSLLEKYIITAISAGVGIPGHEGSLYRRVLEVYVNGLTKK